VSISVDWRNIFNSRFIVLLKKLVQEAPGLYGPEFVVYNVHSATYVHDDARLYVHLNEVNAFMYENHLKQLKKLPVQHANNHLKQAVKRILERQNVADLHADKCANKENITKGNIHLALFVVVCHG